MFEYFPGNYSWSAMVMNSLGMDGEISEIDRFCRPLKEVSGTRETMGTDDGSKSAAWASAWRDLCDHAERLAVADAGKGLRAGASRKYLRAANYGFVSDVISPPDRPEKPEVCADARRRFREGMALSREPLEYVEVPFEGTTLPALFAPAEGTDGPAPCMIHFDGTHDVKEVSYLRHRRGLAERGVSMLIVDHPGSGEALFLSAAGALARRRGFRAIPQDLPPEAARLEAHLRLPAGGPDGQGRLRAGAEAGARLVAIHPALHQPARGRGGQLRGRILSAARTAGRPPSERHERAPAARRQRHIAP